MSISDTLARILADKRHWVAARKAERAEADALARARDADPPRGFARALAETAAAGHYALIAEIKKASPSRGLIRADFDPAHLAQAYREGGATCLSVLTDQPYFQGEDAHLTQARAAVTLPVLRKDFMIDPYQIAESRALGADCVLLIMAALSDLQAAELEDAAMGLGLDVLVEVHDIAEMDRALALKSQLLGINNRDLKTLAVDLATTETLAGRVPVTKTLVSESGLYAPADLARMERAGAAAFLIGESLMKQQDVAKSTAELLGERGPAGAAPRHADDATGSAVA